jgi:8-hydroxy-5-deazaflavin:NADPH oxidoreductase
MKVAIIGAGHIGGNIASRLVLAGHEIIVCFSRDPAPLEAFAEEIGAKVATPRKAVGAADVVVISVPWGVLPDALSEMGSLAGKIVIDTANQFGSGPKASPGQTAAAFNASRMAGARYTKSFNTLTSVFQRRAAERPPGQRVVQWLCGDDAGSKEIVAGLITDAGYDPVDLGGTADCAAMESPRRAGAVYGEEWRLPEALAVVEAVREGRPIPDTPTYGDVGT